MQSVLDAMLASPDFEPIVGITLADIDWKQSNDVVQAKHNDVRRYFEARGVNSYSLCDVSRRKVLSPKVVSPDVVFYQQPWDYAKCQHPALVSRYALTCYVQYYVPNIQTLTFDCGSLFTRAVNRFYVLSEAWRRYYEKGMQKVPYACSYVATGHPSLDAYNVEKHTLGGRKVVIYAPHWSITCPGFMNSEHYSTFMANGELILELAKSHPEIDWVFKPHPNLAHALVKSGAWSQDKVDDYYSQWDKLGGSCYTCEYVELFKRSSAMLTDCGSFLSEYPCTGKPLIRMASSACTIPITEVSKLYIASLYNVNSWEELVAVFNDVVINGNDNKREERMKAARDFGILNSSAAANILADIRNQFGYA